MEFQAVEILGIEMATDFPTTFTEQSSMKLVGYDMTANASRKLYEKTGLKAADIDVVELHDCFSANELITYEALGLCPPGKVNWTKKAVNILIIILKLDKIQAGEFIDQGDNTYGGKVVVNPSGGLISKGHPLGATGICPNI